MYTEWIKERRKDFDAALEFAKQEAAAIRTGRATPSLVEDIPVEYMGARLRVKELASITAPEPRMLIIQPWDKSAIPLIEKAIRESEIGLNPVSDSTSVRLTIPSLTEERRKEFIKLLHSKTEEARIRIRRVREDVLKKVQTAVHDKQAREDDVRRAKEELQKVVDELNTKLDTLVKTKEHELMSS